MAQTIHYSQGLTLDHLTFDLLGVTKYGLTYIALSRVHWKGQIYIYFTLLNKKIQVDHFAQEQMYNTNLLFYFLSPIIQIFNFVIS